MHIIDLSPLEVGVYNDHKAKHITAPPNGWAMIPDDMALPITFPRLGSIEAKEINGVMTVTKMTEGTLPEILEVEVEPTEIEKLRADIEFLAIMTGVEL